MPLAAINILTATIVAVHVAASAMVIVLILLHSGRGGGLSDMFGGGGGGAAGSTVMEKNLDRLTVSTAVVWTFTTLVLALRL